LFEGIVFGRKNRFDFQYMNPIIFYRHIEGTVGSPDNAIAGLDFKANLLHRVQVYGQVMLDEFVLSNVKNNPSNWTNKFALQGGFKYVDAFGIRNLDLQMEYNRVRPFTYSHNDTTANYTHYNQPLAHPLGANFQEAVAIVHYQPAPKWNIIGRAMYFEKGLDSANKNFGGNIFRNNTTRIGDNGYNLAAGAKATGMNSIIQISYELRPNLFLDAALQKRLYTIAGQPGQSNTTLFTTGIRLNMFKRQYDF
jgi:hypothetical protein